MLGYLRLHNPIKAECSWVHEPIMEFIKLLIKSSMELYPKLFIPHDKLIILSLLVWVITV